MSAPLDPETIAMLRAKAVQGEGEAAQRLANFYGLVALDYKQELFWWRIAAEDNLPLGQYNYGTLIADDSTARAAGEPTDGEEGRLEKLRGQYWMDRAKKNGWKGPLDELKSAQKP
jgi:TPR repeat protein